MEMLRGRDGLPGVPGRDGVRGPSGPPGPQGVPGQQGPTSGGAMYVRWGKSSCPQIEGTELMYSGMAGGTRYSQEGGGANLLCMPADPQYTLAHRSGVTGHAYIFKVKYAGPLHSGDNHEVPCAVCHVSTRPAVFMIPAKTSCPSSWTREYYGYIMTSYRATGRGRLMFECVDEDQESLLGSSNGIEDGGRLHHVEAACGADGLSCPPYDQNKEINCVVCTK